MKAKFDYKDLPGPCLGPPIVYEYGCGGSNYDFRITK